MNNIISKHILPLQEEHGLSVDCPCSPHLIGEPDGKLVLVHEHYGTQLDRIKAFFRRIKKMIKPDIEYIYIQMPGSSCERSQ